MPPLLEPVNPFPNGTWCLHPLTYTGDTFRSDGTHHIWGGLGLLWPHSCKSGFPVNRSFSQKGCVIYESFVNINLAFVYLSLNSCAVFGLRPVGSVCSIWCCLKSPVQIVPGLLSVLFSPILTSPHKLQPIILTRTEVQN